MSRVFTAPIYRERRRSPVWTPWEDGSFDPRAPRILRLEPIGLLRFAGGLERFVMVTLRTTKARGAVADWVQSVRCARAVQIGFLKVI
jgi:hypothetical protein